MAFSDEIKSEARLRYHRGDAVAAIAEALGVDRRTLYRWIADERWGDAANRQNTFFVVERRIWQLTAKEGKTLLELFELERLMRIRERLNHEQEKKNSGADHAAEAASDGKKKRGRKPGKNDFTAVDPDELMTKFRDGLFEYQLALWDAREERTRNVLKSRQIGLTFYFAREAFVDAILSGRNKIFLSASRHQADVFKEYIKGFAREWFNVELTGGDKIELHTKTGMATLYFLSTNSSTAQSYHGDLYVDEYFWIPAFAKLKTVASAMSAQKQWRRTFFSTPSTKTHQAYPFWSGDEFNERRRRRNRALAIFPERAELRRGGTLCPDGQWRWIITLDDAERMGCDLFDREQLKQEYSEDEFEMLFNCRFVDDTASVFGYAQLEKCLGDLRNYPAGLAARPVWIGYDPSRSRDGACIVVLAPPTTYRGKFHVLEKITLKDVSWAEQAATIQDLCHKYTVEYIGIDLTGPGSGVCEMVQRFFPAAEGIFYTREKKSRLVMKAQAIIADKRIVWDASWSDIAMGFMQIKRVSAADGNITYRADRSEASGHADAAWALMHALAHEDLILPEVEDRCSYAI